MTDHHEAPSEDQPLPSSTRVEGELPPLSRDPSFWGMTLTQFLGAFNDNVFKQLLLLLATPSAVQLAQAKANGEELPADRQAEAMIVFAMAFLLLSGFAGWLADKMSKRTLIIAAKFAEIVVMGLGMVAFYFYEQVGLVGLFAVLFLMGSQSAFFGPPKYGILPETIRDRDLPQANGIFLMFTFVAIIFGAVLAGAVKELSEVGWPIWGVSAVCVVIACIGTATSLLTRRTTPVRPDARLTLWDFAISPESLQLVKRDRELLLAVLVTSSFWMLGSIVQQSVNALGKSQLGLSEIATSGLTAMLGVGIPIGCLIGGKLSAGKINPRVVAGGAIGLVVCLALMGLRAGPQEHLLHHWFGFWGSAPVLVIAGVFTGIFIVPIQVAVQALPPADEKGRMIALMNQCNWIGIIIGALIFEGSVAFCNAFDQPRNTAFAVGALVMLPIALFYRPKERSLGD